MTCEEVRDLLPEHLLGSLDDTSDARVRKHLRGCADCRAERMRLEDGVAALSHATHEQDPPEELRRHVLDVLSEEWDAPGEQPATPCRLPRRPRIRVALARGRGRSHPGGGVSFLRRLAVAARSIGPG